MICTYLIWIIILGEVNKLLADNQLLDVITQYFMIKTIKIYLSMLGKEINNDQ